jgi:hypothetical protein
MTMTFKSLILAFGLAAALPAFAQTTVPNPVAPAAGPAATSPAATHAAPAGTPAAPAKAGKAAKAAPAQASPAPGGGAGKVWVNAASKVYHCEGSKYYGKTKKGEYMTEAAAKAQGAHGVNGKSCAA